MATLVAASTPGSDPIHNISIIPRAIGSLGYTMQRPTEDRYVITATELTDRMAVLMGGRAAEFIIFGEFSTGAADDLTKVTDIAHQYVARFGMSESIGQAVLEQVTQPYLDSSMAPARRNYSEATSRDLDLADRAFIQRAFEQAGEILEQRRAELDAGARLLLEKETITPADFPAIAVGPALGEAA